VTPVAPAAPVAPTSPVAPVAPVAPAAPAAPVAPAQVAAFENEMRKAGVDWQLNVYSGAAHNFTNPSSPAYNRQVDRRSFEAMKAFFNEVFSL